MHPNLSTHTIDLMRPDAPRTQPRPRLERRARRRLTLRWHRRVDRHARRVAPA